MPASDPKTVGELFARPVPANVVGLPTAENAAAGDGGEPPNRYLLAVAAVLLADLNALAEHHGLRFALTLEETR